MNRLLIGLSACLRLNRRHPVHHASGRQKHRLVLLLGSLGFWLLPTVGMMRPTLAAERIYASFGALERWISIDSLEKYSLEDKIDEDLTVYSQYIGSQRLAQLRTVLMARADLSPVAVSQFLYTTQGEVLLQRLGQVIKTESRQPGFYALRSALILAAADSKGLTLLNVMHQFPTRSIRIDLGRSLEIVRELERLINQSRRAIAFVSQESALQATTTQPTVDFSTLPELRRRGRFTWKKQTLTLYDLSRSRIFLADIYQPLNIQRPAPMIVISHGLGSSRTSFDYLAQQLASYGFAVAVPEHPGSNAEQLRSLLAGRASEVAEPNEFINRPLDVKYLLDQLDSRQKTDPTFKVNLQQVGVIGQSFGGYTALALAGAPLNFDKLQEDCKALNDTLNVSLLLQCRARDLPRTQYNLRDERVKAAIALNPVTSSVFGEASLSQIKIPVMIVSSSNDTIAPALSEQILPFTWLTTPKKHLVLIQGGTHFSTIGESEMDAVTIPPQVIGPDPALARRYTNALSVAFFKTYVADAAEYRPYLSAFYANSISQAPLALSFLQSLTATQVAQAVDGSISVPTP